MSLPVEGRDSVTYLHRLIEYLMHLAIVHLALDVRKDCNRHQRLGKEGELLSLEFTAKEITAMNKRQESDTSARV